jgi:hypothetical protein
VTGPQVEGAIVRYRRSGRHDLVVSDVGFRDGTRRSLEILVTRWPVVRPFLVVGAAAIIAGGITAAVTRPTGFALGSWVAAYLVLVAGVAQIALGVGQARLARVAPRRAEVMTELVAWNAAVVATIVGTLFGAPLVTTLGGIALVVALLRFLIGVRAAGTSSNPSLVLYRFVLTIVLVSTPVGLALAWIRHG